MEMKRGRPATPRDETPPMITRPRCLRAPVPERGQELQHVAEVERAKGLGEVRLGRAAPERRQEREHIREIERAERLGEIGGARWRAQVLLEVERGGVELLLGRGAVG